MQWVYTIYLCVCVYIYIYIYIYIYTHWKWRYIFFSCYFLCHTIGHSPIFICQRTHFSQKHYISLLIIPCIIFYVTNKETLNRFIYIYIHICVCVCVCVCVFTHCLFNINLYSLWRVQEVFLGGVPYTWAPCIFARHPCGIRGAQSGSSHCTLRHWDPPRWW